MGGRTSNESKAKYNAKVYDRINIAVPKGRKAELQAAAERHGQSVNGLINGLIDAWLESERAGAVPAVSQAVGDGPGVVLVSAGGSPTEDICSRSTSLTPPDFEPAPKQETLADVARRLSSMSPEERDKAMGCDDEARERYQERMEQNRQRLAELNAKVGGLSRLEDMERRRLMMMECQDHLPPDDSTQE